MAALPPDFFFAVDLAGLAEEAVILRFIKLAEMGDFVLVIYVLSRLCHYFGWFGAQDSVRFRVMLPAASLADSAVAPEAAEKLTTAAEWGGMAEQ